MLAFPLSTRAQTPEVMPEGKSAAQSPQPSASDARRQVMDHWLEHLSHSGGMRRIAGSIASVLTAGITVTGGVLILTDKGEDKGSFSRIALATLMFVYGGSNVASAIGVLTLPTTDEDRYQRWRTLMSSGSIDELTLAHFEGELAAQAEAAHRARMLSGIEWIGAAVGGSTWIALAASGDLSKSVRISSYIGGGLLVAISAWSSIASFVFESAHEKAYRLYQAGSLPDSAVQHVRVGPLLAAGGGGLSVTGQF